MLVSIKNLSKTFGSIHALNGVSLGIREGEVVGLLGPNGSGKTTLLKILANLICNYSGEVRFMGQKLGVDSKSKIAFLPDVSFIPAQWRVAKTIDFYSDFFGDFDRKKAESLLESLQISQDSTFKSLSKGTKEKLQLVLILSRRAKLYIFDEPIAGVDPVARDVIFRLIMENRSADSSVIISTHLVFSVEKILDSAIFIKYGEILAQDSIANLKAAHNGKNLEEIFKELF